jgi:flagellar hook assembly protein FlgD
VVQQTKLKKGLEVFPNPLTVSLRTGASISFTMPEAGKAEISISNLEGKIVNRILSASLNRGDHSVKWDGCGFHGAELNEGVYFVNLSAPEGISVAKLLLLK